MEIRAGDDAETTMVSLDGGYFGKKMGGITDPNHPLKRCQSPSETFNVKKPACS